MRRGATLHGLALDGVYRYDADIDGFSLHAAVRVEAHDRQWLEQLCRYITRSALSDQPGQLNTAGQVELELETPWRDGTTHLGVDPQPPPRGSGKTQRRKPCCRPAIRSSAESRAT